MNVTTTKRQLVAVLDRAVDLIARRGLGGVQFVSDLGGYGLDDLKRLRAELRACRLIPLRRKDGSTVEVAHG